MKNRSEHPIYKINKKKIFVKATILAFAIVGFTLLIAVVMLSLSKHDSMYRVQTSCFDRLSMTSRIA